MGSSSGGDNKLFGRLSHRYQVGRIEHNQTSQCSPWPASEMSKANYNNFNGNATPMDLMGFDYGPEMYDKWHAAAPAVPAISSETSSAYSDRGSQTFTSVSIFMGHQREGVTFWAREDIVPGLCSFILVDSTPQVHDAFCTCFALVHLEASYGTIGLLATYVTMTLSTRHGGRLHRLANEFGRKTRKYIGENH